MSISVAIVIPTHDRLQTLNILLGQLKTQENIQCRFQIIIIADSDDPLYSEKLIKDHPEIITINGTGNWWFTRSVNEGIKKAQTLQVSHILILNDDCEIDNDYLHKVTTAVETYPDSITGSICFNNEKRNMLIFSGIKEIKWHRYKQVLYHPKFSSPNETLSGLHPSKALHARGMMIPLSVIDQLGYFDEKFIQYTSDYEYCYRAIKKNISVYISWDSKVYDNISFTSTSMSHIKKNISSFCLSFFDKRSLNYLPSILRIIMRNTFWMFWPMAFVFFIGGSVRGNFYKLKDRP